MYNWANSVIASASWTREKVSDVFAVHAHQMYGLRQKANILPIDLFSHTYAKTGSRIRAQPQARAYQVFDQKVTSILDNRRYSRARKYESNTLEGLAEQLGIASPEVFAQEIMDFNTACQPGNFDAAKLDGLKTQGLSTPKSNWAQPIDSPPYVAYAVTAGITFTYGGLKADLDGRVYSNEDHIMPGLYAAGEMTGVSVINRVKSASVL